MKDQLFTEACIYYTACHEWIGFSNKFGYIGISHLKTGNNQKIKKINLVKVYGLKHRGEVFAHLQMDYKQVDVHMPVDGTIIQVNNLERLLHENLLLTAPEAACWLVKITLSNPSEKKDLLNRKQYLVKYPTQNRIS